MRRRLCHAGIVALEALAANKNNKHLTTSEMIRMSLRFIGFFENANAPERMVLPKEVGFGTIAHLSLKTFLNARLVSKQFSELSRDDYFWRRLFKERFLVDITGPNCMQQFILHSNCVKAIDYEIPEFKSTIPASAGMELINSEFLAFTKAAEQVKKKLITEAYMELRRFMYRPAGSWTTYLRGVFEFSFSHYFNEAEYAINANRNCGKGLILTAAREGHPLAMLHALHYFVSEKFGDVGEEEKKSWLIKLSQSKSAVIIFSLAMISLNNRSFTDLLKPWELLIQAAKQGHAPGAYELARLYLTHTVYSNGIPFGDREWEFNDFCLQNPNLLSPEVDVDEEKLTRLKEFANQGVALASDYLVNLHRSGNRKNWELVESYEALTSKNWHSCMPARRERAIYWLEQAVEGGMEEAQALLEKINKTAEHNITNIFDYGSRENSPQGSPDSSPQNSPRRS